MIINMENKLFTETEDQKEDLNCMLKKIKFNIFDSNGNIKNSLEDSFCVFDYGINTPLLLLLEPQNLNNIKSNSQSFFDLKISIQVYPKNNLESELNENFINNNQYNNSSLTTANSSPKVNKNIKKFEFLQNCEFKSNFNTENNLKKRESIKSSIKRQLTSNPYVDICKNPEWPFTKKNKVSKSDNHISTINLSDSNNTKKSSKAKTRQWLDSISTLFDGIYTQRSTLGRSAGLGLFSDRFFEKNDIITEFVGWVIDRKEALRLRSVGKATHICDLVKPSLYLDGEKDPKPFIGGGSFANDGSTFLGGPGNNSKFWKWYDEREGRTRVFLKATQQIKPNEEIFVGYCKDYWLDFAEKDINKLNQVSNLTIKSSNFKLSKRKKKDIQIQEKESTSGETENLDSDDDYQDSKINNYKYCKNEFNSYSSQSQYLSDLKHDAENKNSTNWDIIFNWSTSDEDNK